MPLGAAALPIAGANANTFVTTDARGPPFEAVQGARLSVRAWILA
jgi:hypothetical protein